MRRKGRTPEALPLMEALQRVRADSQARTAAFRLLRADLTRIRSPAEFRELYAGLFHLTALLAPLGLDYQRAVKELRRSLDAAADYHGVQQIWHIWMNALLNVLLVYVPPETWDRVRPIFEKQLGFDMLKRPEKQEHKPLWRT